VQTGNTPGTCGFFFVHMSVLQAAAMATSNCKDNYFFAIFNLLALLSRVSLGKIVLISEVL